MPVMKTDGGYRYGKSGKIYYGKDARKKAEQQGKAIRISQAKRKRKKKKS